MVSYLPVFVIALALIFDFINGFHDAANSIATIVSTKVLTWTQAVFWAAAFNFLAYFVITDHKIANTIAKTVNEDFVTLTVILSGLIAAISWNLITWWHGTPSSSSHTLIGGFAGAGLANAFFKGADMITAVNLHYITVIALYIALAPCIGLGIAWFLTLLVNYFFQKIKPGVTNRSFKIVQLFSSAALSFAHGGNDAQKVMGIIYITLVSAKMLGPDAAMPNWVPLACYTAIALGTLSGGWRIVKTIGMKITKLTPPAGASAETAGAITLLVTEYFGIPVSTTHTLAGAIAGTGLAKKSSVVHWEIIRRMVWAWVITIPISALLAGLVFSVVRFVQ